MYKTWVWVALAIIATEQLLLVAACRRWSGKALHRAGRNLTLALVYRVFFAASVTLPLMLWATNLRLWHRPTAGHWAIAFLIFDILVLDWYNYFYHFLSHRVPFFWPFHAVHHMDERMDMSTATRSHFFDKLLAAGLRMPILIVLAIPMDNLLWSEALTILGALFHHSGRLRVPQWFENTIGRVVTTPAFHSVHHSRFLPFTDSNYSFVFCIWDSIFGTCLRRLPYPEMRIGLDEQTDDSTVGLLVNPFRKVFEPKGEAPRVIELGSEEGRLTFVSQVSQIVQ